MADGIFIPLDELAEKLDAEIVGDPSLKVSKIAPIDSAKEGDLTFLSDPRKSSLLGETGASAIIVPRGVEAEGKSLLVVRDPYVAFAKAQSFFHPRAKSDGKISPLSFVHPEAKVGENVSIGPFAYVEEGVEIGKGSILFPHVYLGKGVIIGEECLLYSGVKIYHDCRLGDHVIVHSGAVVGSDGFGYAWDGKEHLKIPQVGKVIIGNEVEIGANTTIDRGTLKDTIIEDGVKIDNLVQVGHNVRVGRFTILVAQVGIAGSTEIGEGSVLAGQVGVAGHIKLGKGTKVAAKSGVHRSTKDGEVLAGTPAMPHKSQLRVLTMLPKLPELRSKVKQMERRLDDLEEKLSQIISQGEDQ